MQCTTQVLNTYVRTTHCTVLLTKNIITTPHRHIIYNKSSVLYIFYKLACTVHALYTRTHTVTGMCMLAEVRPVLQVLVPIHLVKDIIGYLI